MKTSENRKIDAFHALNFTLLSFSKPFLSFFLCLNESIFSQPFYFLYYLSVSPNIWKDILKQIVDKMSCMVKRCHCDYLNAYYWHMYKSNHLSQFLSSTEMQQSNLTHWACNAIWFGPHFSQYMRQSSIWNMPAKCKSL